MHQKETEPTYGGAPKRVEVWIEFNSTQIKISTDAREVVDYLLASHRSMISQEASHIIGELEIVQNARGYACVGFDKPEYNVPSSHSFDWLARDILDHFIQRHGRLLWLHSGSVAKGDRGLLLVGSSTQGKSTLSTALSKLEWHYLSDEVAPIRVTDKLILPYARTPRRRLDPGRELDASDAFELPRESFDIEPDFIGSSSVLEWIVFPRFTYAAAPKLFRIAPGEAALELVKNCSNFLDHQGAVTRVAELAMSVPCYALEYGDSVAAARELDRLASEILSS